MVDPSPPQNAPAALPGPTLLEDVLIALQKTFSRLSSTTAARESEEFRDKARALIVGEVEFEITLNIEPTLVPDSKGVLPAKPGNLRYCADKSGFPIRLNGRIATDLRHSEAAAAPTPPPGPTQ